MPRPVLLSDEEINELMNEIPLWNLSGSWIIRELVAENFAGAIGIVNTIAIIAEKLDHHPDIFIYGWNKIRISSKTHDKDGLTELDFLLAKKIDELKY